MTKLSEEPSMNGWKSVGDYNHPCIVTWVPLNESWGVPFISVDRRQQEFSQTLYHLLKSFDSTRLVVGNDGWEMTETDLCAIHNYDHGEKNDEKAHAKFRESLSCREELLYTYTAGRKIFVDGWKDRGQPVLLTELEEFPLRNRMIKHGGILVLEMGLSWRKNMKGFWMPFVLQIV